VSAAVHVYTSRSKATEITSLAGTLLFKRWSTLHATMQRMFLGSTLCCAEVQAAVVLEDIEKHIW